MAGAGARERRSTRARVKALEGMGWITQRQGDIERAQTTYEEMLQLSRELGDKEDIVTSLNSRGTLALAQGDNELARTLLEENLVVLQELENEGSADTVHSRFHALNLLAVLALNDEGDYARGAALLGESLALARKGEDARRIVQALCNLGYATLLQGNHLEAIALCDEALAFAHQLGTESADIVPEALINLGLASLELGERERAATSFEEALTSSQKAGIKPSVINALEGMASLNGARGETPRAARLWGAAEAARELTGIALPPGELALHEGHLATVRAQLGETAWEEVVAEGQAMSLDEAAEYALGKVPEPLATPEEPAAGDPAGDLTRREREVVTQVVRGMTNRQIAGELSISERTAANHVARILRKLHLHSRTQIATWATEQGLLGP